VENQVFLENPFHYAQKPLQVTIYPHFRVKKKGLYRSGSFQIRFFTAPFLF